MGSQKGSASGFEDVIISLGEVLPKDVLTVSFGSGGLEGALALVYGALGQRDLTVVSPAGNLKK